MLITPTIDRLHALALARHGPRPRRAARASRLRRRSSFEERLGLLVDREMQDRENRRLARHLRAARLRSDAVIEDLDLRAPRGLDRATVLDLAAGALGRRAPATCSSPDRPAWARRSSPAPSPTPPSARGTPRSTCGCRGSSTSSCSARADGRLPRLMAAWARVDVLVLDDLGLQPLPTPRRPTCSRSSRTAPARARPSSPASSRSATGTRPWASPPSPTPSSTAWSTAPTAWSSRARPCGGPRRPQRARSADGRPSGAPYGVPH